MWNLNYETSELFYKTDSQTGIKEFMVTKEESWGGGAKLGVWDWQM